MIYFLFLSIANSADPDEMPPYVAFHLSLPCFSMYMLPLSSMKGLKVKTDCRASLIRRTISLIFHPKSESQPKTLACGEILHAFCYLVILFFKIDVLNKLLQEHIKSVKQFLDTDHAISGIELRCWGFFDLNYVSYGLHFDFDFVIESS